MINFLYDVSYVIENSPFSSVIVPTDVFNQYTFAPGNGISLSSTDSKTIPFS